MDTRRVEPARARQKARLVVPGELLVMLGRLHQVEKTENGCLEVTLRYRKVANKKATSMKSGEGLSAKGRGREHAAALAEEAASHYAGFAS